MENELLDDLDKFNYNYIWVTKKIRMDAAENRSKRNDYLNYFLIYYSGCLAVMSFLNLYDPKGFNLALFSSMIALILPSANIFQYKANYSKQTSEYRDSYLKLSKLENEIKTFIPE